MDGSPAWSFSPGEINEKLHELGSSSPTKSPLHIHALALAENAETLFACGHNRAAGYSLKAFD
jgi:hypothetical protein